MEDWEADIFGCNECIACDYFLNEPIGYCFFRGEERVKDSVPCEVFIVEGVHVGIRENNKEYQRILLRDGK